jgi:hypothetical protein
LKEEKAILEGMVKSHDELIMEIAKETKLDCMGEDSLDEEEDEDADGRGDAAAPPVPAPPAATPEEIIMVHEVILADAEPEMLQLHLYHTLMMDYKESLPRMVDDLDDLDDDPNEGRSDMDEWFPEVEAIMGIESSSLSLKFRFKNNSLGFV